MLSSHIYLRVEEVEVEREEAGVAVPALREAPLEGVALPAREENDEDDAGAAEVAREVDVGAAVRVVVAEPFVRTLLVTVCVAAAGVRLVEDAD